MAKDKGEPPCGVPGEVTRNGRNVVVRSPLPRPARDACPAGYGGRREPGRWRWDEGQAPASVSPYPLWPTQEGWGSMGWPPGRLGRTFLDQRVPCQKGPRAPAGSQGRRGRSLPPAGPRLVTAMRTGLGWGQEGPCLRLVVESQAPSLGRLPPVAPAEGVGQGDIRETAGSSQERGSWVCPGPRHE